MRMAKASTEDIEAAMLLNGMMQDVFESDQYPRGLDGEYFDEGSFEDLRMLYDRLREVYRRCPGGMNRVIFGMDTLLQPGNRLVDPDKDHLAAHPAIRWVEGEQEVAEGRGV